MHQPAFLLLLVALLERKVLQTPVLLLVEPREPHLLQIVLNHLLFSTMCSAIELHDSGCIDACQLILLRSHDMQRIINFSCLWKLPNIMCVGEVVSMSSVLALSLLKTPPMDTMG